MTDIASLGIRVTSDGVAKAQADLDKLATSGDRAAQATDRLSKANANAAKKYASPQYRQQADDLAKLVGQIDPTVAALDKLDKQQAKLAAFRKAGILSSDDFKTYSAAIDESRVKITSASEAVHKFSLNNAMARRELGYLVKDLATGQYGRFQQSALTLANASGVMSLAFSGIGAAIGGVLAALGLFAVAAFKSAEQEDAFNKALIATGNYAGKTSDQLQQMARNMATASTSQRDAADALAAVAASGRFTAEQIGLVGQAAIDMARLTGQSTDTTIKQFESLQHAPVEALLKLNETQHFLTETIYEQIKALQDQGKEQDAANLAIQTYANSAAAGAAKIVESGNLLVKSFHGVRDAAKEAAASIFHLFDAQTERDKFNVLIENRDAAKSLIDRGMGSDAFLGTTASKYYEQATKKAQAMQDAEIRAEKEASQKSLIDKQTIAAAESDAEVKEFATNAQKRNAEKLAAQGRADARYAAAMAAGNKKLAQKILDDEVKIQAGIAAKYKDHKPPHVRADPMAALDTLTARAVTQDMLPNDQETALNRLLAEQVKQLQAIADAGGKAIQKGASLAKVQAQVASGVAATNEYFGKQAALLDQKNAVAMAKYTLALDASNDALKRQVDSQVARISLGDKEYTRQQQINDLYVKGAEDLRRLQAERAAPGANTALIDQQIAATQANIDRQVSIVSKGYQDMDRAQSSWINGAKRAYANILDEASNVAGQTDNLFTNAFDSMTEALADFATTGKLNFKGLVTSILADLAKMEIRIAASRILQSVLGSFAGGGQDYSGTTSAGGGFTYNMPTYNANGGVYSSPSLSTYSGQIVTQPTMFAFAKGAGIMGEAGPEAILPLSRGADGKLGVKAGGSGGDVNISQTFVIDSNGNASGKTSGAGDDSIRQFAGKMKSVAQQTILDEQRPGGSLWRMGQRA